MKDPSKVVLVIEDSDSSRKLVQHLLELHGYTVLQATDGTEGWRMAREHRPDLILMDIQLPDVSGLVVTRWLKNDDRLKSIPIIAVTAFALHEHKKSVQNAGCDSHISKPISITSFVQTVERFLPKGQPNPAECELMTA